MAVTNVSTCGIFKKIHIFVLLISCSSWLWFIVPYTGNRKCTHGCLRFLHGSERLGPKDPVHQIKGKIE